MTWKHPDIMAAPAYTPFGDLAPVCRNCGYTRGQHYQKNAAQPHIECPHERYPEKYKSILKKKISVII